MPLDEDVEELKKEAVEMGKYYHRGFRSLIHGILSNAELFLISGQKNEAKDKSYSFLEEFERIYSEIPFDELDKEGFFPLFEVNKILPQFRDKLEYFFKEPNRDNLRNFEEEKKIIKIQGSLYKSNLRKLIQKVRQYPGENDFEVIFPHPNNKNWSSFQYSL